MAATPAAMELVNFRDIMEGSASRLPTASLGPAVQAGLRGGCAVAARVHAQGSSPHVAEPHELPDAGVGRLLVRPPIDEVLELHLAREPLVRAVEPRQLGQQTLGARD